MVKLREKWISAHPVPPQDLTKFPDRSPTELEQFDEFRRRPEPPYDVFSEPLPGATSEYRLVKIGGIIYVFPNNNGSQKSSSLIHQSEGDAQSPVEERPKDSLYPVGSFQEFVDDFHFVSCYS